MKSSVLIHGRLPSFRKRMSGLRRGVLAAVAAAGGLTFSAQVSAQATPVVTYEWISHFQNWATSKCLESDGAGSVYTSTCLRGNKFQQWEVRNFLRMKGYLGHDLVEMKNHATKRCLGHNTGPAMTWNNCSNRGTIRGFLREAKGPNWSNVQLVSNYAVGIYACLDASSGRRTRNDMCNWGRHQTWKRW